MVEKVCTKADVLIDTFRPGVMERLGLGPDHLMALNRKLIYARLTGYGQQGPLAKRAGHDINFLAISGVLSLLGDAKPNLPKPLMNLHADFAGGSLTCALGICLALFERNQSGLGQIIDANMVAGTRYLSSFLYYSRNDRSAIAQYIWPQRDERGRNLLDGGAPFYSIYETKDGKFMAVGALEPQFFYLLLQGLGLDQDKYQYGLINEEMRQEFVNIFKSKTQQEWTEIFDNVDACVTPILSYDEANNYDHNKISKLSNDDGSPRPAPILSRTPGTNDNASDNIECLSDFLKRFDIRSDESENYISSGVVKKPGPESKL